MHIYDWDDGGKTWEMQHNCLIRKKTSTSYVKHNKLTQESGELQNAGL